MGGGFTVPEPNKNARAVGLLAHVDAGRGEPQFTAQVLLQIRMQNHGKNLHNIAPIIHIQNNCSIMKNGEKPGAQQGKTGGGITTLVLSV